MKPEVLRALLMDRELGELAPEVAELLAAYMAAVPSAQAEADAVTRTVRTTRETVRRYPELAPTTETEKRPENVVIVHWPIPWLARAAAVIAVAMLAGWLGYRAGNANMRGEKPAILARGVDHRFDNLWTRYQVAYDSQRAAFVVEKQD